MKNRVVAPTICVVLALMAAACGGGSESDSPAPPPPPPPGVPAPPGPAPVPPPAVGANSVAQVKADATGSHEAIPIGLTTAGPMAGQRTPPAGTVALGGYGELYIAPGHSASSTRVQLRNFETYALRGGKWTRVQYSERVVGAAYTMNYGGAGVAADVRAEANGMSVKPANGTVFRFWPQSGLTGFAQSPVPFNSVEAVFTTVQARLITDAGQTDDRARARMVVSTAADWVSNGSLYATELPSPADILAGTPLGVGKLRLVGNDWRATNFHSASGAQVDALGEAQESGGVAPIANSSRIDAPAAKRVILVGDSISEGSTSPAQNSFRRPLWNSVVGDASHPLVDFVGTRSGVRSVGGTCGNPAALTAPATIPDFDADHEAYWGWCANDVAAVLPGSLARLAAQIGAPRTDNRRPDVALVHLGTNDILQQTQDPSLIAGELVNLVGQLRAANRNIRVVVAQVIPVSRGNSTESSQVPVLNAQIAAQVGALSTAESPVTLVDQFAGFNAATDLYDGVHPTSAGEQKMAVKWLPALKEAIR
jgi:GDSL-like Lipase/Acylhydrolase family